MSACSETDSEPESELATGTASSLTAFARFSAMHPSQGQTLSWAVDTLVVLDFQLLREDNTLHGLVQDCACMILDLFNNVLQQGSETDNACSFIPDIASILRPSFFCLLFQYRRLFHAIAARDFTPNSVPLPVVCWVDLVLAKLGDVVAFIAAGLDVNHPDRSLPESLGAQREEDNLRAAIQLPDNWDMLPSTLTSERASVAAKRLAVRLMLGRYILYSALSGQVGADNTIHGLFSAVTEFLRQSATRVDELQFALGGGSEYLVQQERLTSAMAISLFAVVDMAQNSNADSKHAPAFRPQTMAAAMQLLRFVLRNDGHPIQMNIFSPLHCLDSSTSVIIRWGVVPQWAWSIWLEYRSLHADTILCLTMAYIQHQKTSSMALLEAPDLIVSGHQPSNVAATISMFIDLIYRFVLVLSADRQAKFPTSMMGVLDESCWLISQWINQNTCGIRDSMECCKALIILFGCLSWNEQHFALSDLVIECLTHMSIQCTRDAWETVVKENNFNFLENFGQSFIQAKMSLSLLQDNLSESSEICAVQLMQFLVVTMSKGIQLPNLETIVEFIETAGEQVYKIPERSVLCETFLTCLASGNLSGIYLPFNKVMVAADEDAVWSLGMRSGSRNLFLASAFSLYITSTLADVEPLTYLEGLEHLLDTALLICSQDYAGEDEPLGLVVLPTICNALVHLLEHRDGNTGAYVSENTRIAALYAVLRAVANNDDLIRDGFGTRLKQRVSSTASRLLREIDGEREASRNEVKGEHELVFCRLERPRLLYIVVV